MTTTIGPLWTLRNGERVLHAEVYQDDQRYEIRFFSDGLWFARQPFGSREQAERYANLFQQDLLTAGWVKARR